MGITMQTALSLQRAGKIRRVTGQSGISGNTDEMKDRLLTQSLAIRRKPVAGFDARVAPVPPSIFDAEHIAGPLTIDARRLILLDMAMRMSSSDLSRLKQITLQ
ncbi:MAG: hypothetical protein IH605_11860 [Burkholderiales bacterium]|nr:hypothetical protein [Burkholderiales bacterium]